MLDAMAEGAVDPAALDEALRRAEAAESAEAALEEALALERRLRAEDAARAAATRDSSSSSPPPDEALLETLRGSEATVAGLRRDLEEATREAETLRAEGEKRDAELARLRAHVLDVEAADDETASRRDAETDALATQVASLERECETLRRGVQARDAELANLQLALEHFDGEAESAERAALETAALREERATLAAEAAVARERAKEAERTAEAERRRAEAAEEAAAKARSDAQKATAESSKARAALRRHGAELAARAAAAAAAAADDDSGAIDRRVVAKLLMTYFERDRSPEVLDLMMRMLGVSEAEKERAGLGPGGRHTRGVLGAVARTPAAIVGGALAVAGSVAKAPVVVAEAFREEEEKETVAERWVEFLAAADGRRGGERGRRRRRRRKGVANFHSGTRWKYRFVQVALPLDFILVWLSKYSFRRFWNTARQFAPARRSSHDGRGGAQRVRCGDDEHHRLRGARDGRGGDVPEG
jgi:murein DD-endopeptidase MepM/ murein hydrolase activator NlpD